MFCRVAVCSIAAFLLVSPAFSSGETDAFADVNAPEASVAIETTHDFHAVAPVILVCVVADAIAVRYMPHSIMTEKLARMGFGAGQDYESNSLKQLRVADVMVRDVTTVQPEETVRSAAP